MPTTPAWTNLEWDAFLRRSPYGSFQQSRLWHQFKAPDGWHHHRLLFPDQENPQGGVQLLWKARSFLKLGYISKGPVIAPDADQLIPESATAIIQAARKLGLHALVLQAPDDDQRINKAFAHAGFFPANPSQVIEATYLLDVQGPIETIRKRMKRNVRQSARIAREHLSFRIGNKADLPAFFGLMATTCERQKSKPNPSSASLLADLWDLFAPTGEIHLFLVECDSKPIAGLLCLAWGKQLVFWKKGWNGNHHEFHPNELLHDGAIEWANANGYTHCDFCSLDYKTALHLLSGSTEKIPGRVRDVFNLRFGGFAKILPPPLLWIPNPLIRILLKPFFAARKHA